jgi:glycosyltransferase involved in cell wall biosynthesis
MMRAGDKLASYRLLAEALSRAADVRWTLDVAGDGPARAEVEALLAPFGDRVTLRGVVSDRARLAQLYGEADLLVWPAVNEAYGMVFLEAALQGCPALAGRTGGVPGVVKHGETGFLVSNGDADAFAGELRRIAADRGRLENLRGNAAAFVREQRSMADATHRLKDIIDSLIATGRAP